LQILLTKHNDILQCSIAELKRQLQADDIFAGGHQNNFLAAGWQPSSMSSAVKLKRNGEGKNAKSLSCAYLKRSAFSLDDLPVIESVKFLIYDFCVIIYGN
jgi:hypothetical protein